MTSTAGGAGKEPLTAAGGAGSRAGEPARDGGGQQALPDAAGSSGGNTAPRVTRDAGTGDDAGSSGPSDDGMLDDAGSSTPPDASADMMPVVAPPYEGIYTADDKWLCRPGLSDNPCVRDLTVTAFLPDGTTTRTTLEAPTGELPVDCFYLYPTVDPGLLTPPRNLDFPDIDRTTVLEVMFSQSRPYRALCNLYAPLYRQVSLNTFEADEQTREERLEIAYRDATSAFDYLLAHTSAERPIVLLAHSQGSRLMLRLLQRRFETDARLMKRLVVAVLAGPLGGFSVPRGQRAGGSLQQIPLCAAAEETGCVLTWNTFYSEATPAQDYGALGTNLSSNDDLGCNPGFYDMEPARLRGALFLTRSAVGPASLSLSFGLRRVDTDYARFADFYTGRCAIADNGKSYLEVAIAPLSGDRRDNPVPFDNFVLSDRRIGLHAIDYSFIAGEVMDAVAQKITSHAAALGP